MDKGKLTKKDIQPGQWLFVTMAISMACVLNKHLSKIITVDKEGFTFNTLGIPGLVRVDLESLPLARMSLATGDEVAVYIAKEKTKLQKEIEEARTKIKRNKEKLEELERVL